jgi:ERF superfamily
MTKTETKDSADLLAGVDPTLATKQKRQQVAKAAEPAKSQAVAVLPSPANMLAVIAAAAANPGVDVEKMRALLDMQREIMQEEARIAFTQDYIAMQKEMPSINRDGRIVIEKGGRIVQKTPFATFENIHAVTKPILREHGFALWTEPDIGENNRIVMRGHLDHVKGHGKTCAMSLPLENSGSKNDVQGVGSSLSYGRRYCAINLLNIVSHAPQDADRDGNDAPKEETEAKINGSQAKELMKAIDENDVEMLVFMGKYKINAAHELPLRLFDEALKACRDYGARVRAAKEKTGGT